MRGGIRIGSIAGIPIYISASWFFVLSILTVVLGNSYRAISPSLYLLYGGISATLFFISIAANKVARGVVSKLQGAKVEMIAISFMAGSGSTDFEQEPKDANALLVLAVSSPLTNLVFSIVGFAIAWLIAGDIIFSNNPRILETISSNLGSVPAIWAEIMLIFARINLIFTVFSLIPSLPFEGGQILRAVVWKITGDRFVGKRWAAQSGQWLGILLIILGFLNFANGIIGFFLILLGWFLLSNAGLYKYMNNLQQALLETDAEATMTRDFRLVDTEISVREFADKFLLMEERDSNPIYVASANGRDRGIVMGAMIRDIDSHEWQEKSLISMVKSLDEIDTVQLKTKLPEIVNLLEQKKLRYVIVRSPVGSVAGVIDHGDVIKALSNRLIWKLPSEYVKQVKTEGKFPSNFRLGEICEQLSKQLEAQEVNSKDN